MGANRWMKMSFHTTLGIAWLGAAGMALHGGIVEANAQEAVTERSQGDATGVSMTEKRPQDAPELPSYYQGDTAQTEQRGLDRREVEQAQDRYYDQKVRGDATGGPVTDVGQAPDAPELPSYYQGDTAETKQRGLDRTQVEQAQDRYYRQQSENALKRTETMEREADEYYGRK